MIPEFGQFTLILALLFSAIGMAPLFTRAPVWGAVTQNVTRVLFVLVSLGFAALTACFVQSDFSVQIVVENSHTLKPLLYKISGVWGNHEGSLLLWVWVLSLCGFLVSLFEKRLSPDRCALVLGVLAVITFAFLALLLFTSNPFLRVDPAPLNGNDLNPLLQDPGLAFHPPLLYIGYVGGAISFAVVMAAMWRTSDSGDIQPWAPVLRTWALFAWSFLTAGLILGAWWAYYELGWGGWWFWDPVENAALVPWLTGTALLHSVRVLAVRGTLQRWTVLLAILTFALGVLGTFLVRSGVLTSVHAFASDPLRGLAILAVFAVLIGGAFVVLALRWPTLGTEQGVAPISREGAILINNIFLAVAAATVLLGTLYPLIIDALGLPAITVGPPYFNATFVPLLLPLLLLLGVGQTLGWGRTQNWAVQRRILMASGSIGIVVLIAAGWLVGTAQLLPLFGFAAGALVIAGTLFDARHWWKLAAHKRNEAGKLMAHVGLGVMVLGISGTALGTEQIVKMTEGSKTQFAGYELQYKGHGTVPGKNYVAERGTLLVYDGAATFSILPERRYFPVADRMTTEAAIHTTWRGDLFASIGATQPDGSKTVRLRWNPLQVWIWLGAALMALGGAVAMNARRQKAST